LAIHYHRFSPANYFLFQYIAHRWEYTDVIADFSSWPPVQLLPTTHLVHGTYLLWNDIDFGELLQGVGVEVTEDKDEKREDSTTIEDAVP